MKQLKLIIFSGILILVIFYNSCSSSTSIYSDSEKLINTNGIYIAINNNSNSFRKNGDSITPVLSIKIIRFLSKSKAIIIPDNITENEIFDSVKVRKLYNWCLEFENKNPSDKSFIYFKPNFINDSIYFIQKAPEANFEYKGINFKDSIILSYKTTNLNFGNNPNKKQKFLIFKFYKLN